MSWNEEVQNYQDEEVELTRSISQGDYTLDHGVNQDYMGSMGEQSTPRYELTSATSKTLDKSDSQFEFEDL